MAERIAPDTWTPSAWSHDAVMEMQARLDPARMMQYADDWHRQIDSVTAVFNELNHALAAQLDGGWRGGGADAAAGAVRAYVAGSLDGLGHSRSVAQRIADLSDAAGELRGCITPPEPGEAAERCLDEALRQVLVLYSGPAVAAGNAVEDIPPPPEPFGLDKPDASVMPALTPTQPAATAPPFGSPPAPPIGAAPAIDAIRVSAHPHDGLLHAGGPESMLGAPTHTAAAMPTSAGDSIPVNADRAALAPASPTSVAATAQSPGATPSGTPSRSAPITPFLGGAYPGHAGRDGGAEHRTPSYLITLDHATDLIGPLPKVAPPVIGE